MAGQPAIEPPSVGQPDRPEKSPQPHPPLKSYSDTSRSHRQPRLNEPPERPSLFHHKDTKVTKQHQVLKQE
ncbi:hypothetical protein PLANPX_1638 [Lacipirellula parvula]|uniref:Uncharacterized protein n=1 Tax=Lacipirellula parvula TaxID=2650471 RepID=A0A5K7XCD2_9BACT|nr:hypothetical protein PLANPX_1638 [Lacipirellula parvula]